MCFLSWRFIRRFESYESNTLKSMRIFKSSMIQSERALYCEELKRREKARANEEKMKLKAEEAREAKVGNIRYHWEHLCNAEIMKT